MEDKTQNPFTAHFHEKIHLLIKPNNHIHLKEPNQYPLPAELNPKHESLGQDLEELKHFRNVIAAFLNYKVTIFIWLCYVRIIFSMIP